MRYPSLDEDVPRSGGLPDSIFERGRLPSDPEASLDRQQLIVEAARRVIADVAPQELPLTPISTAYFANPEDTLRPQSSKDEPLGFGVPGDAVQLLTPFALAVTTQVVAFLAEEIRKSVKAETPG